MKINKVKHIISIIITEGASGLDSEIRIYGVERPLTEKEICNLNKMLRRLNDSLIPGFSKEEQDYIDGLEECMDRLMPGMQFKWDLTGNEEVSRRIINMVQNKVWEGLADLKCNDNIFYTVTGRYITVWLSDCSRYSIRNLFK